MDLAIGDEQTPGYNPQALNNRTTSKTLTKVLNTKTISKGIKGASLTIKGKSNVLHQLNQFSLPAYDRIFLFYGMNDYLYSDAKLGEIGQKLTAAINEIRRKNSWIKIYGILPLPMYDKSGKAYAKKQGLAGYTFHDLMAMLSITYANNNVKSLNWMTLVNPIVNRNNYKQRLIDGRYPTKQTYQLMADRIGKFVKHNEASGNSQASMPKAIHPTRPNWAKKQTKGNRHEPVVSFGKLPTKKHSFRNKSNHSEHDKKSKNKVSRNNHSKSSHNHKRNNKK